MPEAANWEGANDRRTHGIAEADDPLLWNPRRIRRRRGAPLSLLHGLGCGEDTRPGPEGRCAGARLRGERAIAEPRRSARARERMVGIGQGQAVERDLPA